jgi:hypothetical protein
MPSDLHASTFAPHVDSVFAVPLPDGPTVPLTLYRVEEHEPFEGQPRPDPFSLWFSGPEDAPLPQGVYRLEHDALGPLELFIVPRQPGADRLPRYEALFN